MHEEERSKIEDVKRHLYDPDDHNMTHTREGILHQVDHDVSFKWQDDDKIKENNDFNKKMKKPHTSPFKKFFIISLVFFVVTIGFAFYRFSNNNVSVSNDNIEIKVIGNAFTKGGEELPLQIEITNKNNANLELSNLMIEYPKGAADDLTDMTRLPKDNIGTIKPGETVIRSIKVKLFGEEKTSRNVKISLEYHPEGSNAIFTKDFYYPVTISIAPLSLKIDSPTEITSNQPISFKVTATLNTSLPDDNPILQLVYPNNFIFEEAIPAPTFGNSIWDLSLLQLEKPMMIQVDGRLIGQDGDQQVLHAYAGIQNANDQTIMNVVYSSTLEKILITKPFLDVKILVNGQDYNEYSVSGGSKVGVEVKWVNNLTTRITDAQIIVNLSGNAFDKAKINANAGFYNSSTNQIIWDKNQLSNLSEINPGESGSASFTFQPLSFLGNSNIVKDPKVSINVSIKGRQPLDGYTYNDINNFSEKIVKVLSDFQIVSSAFYTSGYLPPKAESETKYTVTWTLYNSSNTISQAQAKAVLPIYVNWAGLASGTNDNLTYNDITREVIWNIGQVIPNIGITSNRDISFVVSLKPSLYQVNSIPQLMKEVNLSGIDNFTNTTIKNTYGAITTMLLNDPNFKPGDGRVVQ